MSQERWKELPEPLVREAVEQFANNVGEQRFRPFDPVAEAEEGGYRLRWTKCRRLKESGRIYEVEIATDESVPVRVLWPCGWRACTDCSIFWKRKQEARMFSGTQENGRRLPKGRFRFWTITAPALVEDVKDWNYTLTRRFHKVWEAAKKRYDFLDSYFYVKEFQERDLLHIHALIRQTTGQRISKEDIVPGGWLSTVLEQHGFGGHYWQKVNDIGGLVGYFSKHLVETVQDTRLRHGERVTLWGWNWSLSWFQHRGPKHTGPKKKAMGDPWTERGEGDG